MQRYFFHIILIFQEITHISFNLLCTFTKMLDYPVKILIAFGQTFNEEGGKEFFTWLLDNGYPELAALSSAIRGSREAFGWLMKNKYPHFAALDEAIDKSPKAYAWLRKHNFDFLVILADAVNQRSEAIEWLSKYKLFIFLDIAGKIRNYRDRQSFDYHKLHF